MLYVYKKITCVRPYTNIIRKIDMVVNLHNTAFSGHFNMSYA